MYDFDFKTFFRTLLSRKRYFFINVLIATAIGIVVAFSLPKTYKAQIRLASENSKSGLSGSMGGLAAMAGINLNNSEDAISPELYPMVVASHKFLINLLYVPVKTQTGTAYSHFLTYSQEQERGPWWSEAGKSLVRGIKKIFSGTPTTLLSAEKRINPQHLTLQEELFLKSFKKKLVCSIDKETDVITLSAYSQDPAVAQQLVEAAAIQLQKFITDYRTNKTRIDLQYYQLLQKQLYHKYEKAKQAYVQYADAHNDLVLKSFSTTETDLENEMQNAFNEYTQMTQQVSSAEGKVQEKTPAFTIVEDAYVPNLPDSPKKLLILLSFVFVSFVTTIMWYYLKLIFFRPS